MTLPLIFQSEMINLANDGDANAVHAIITILTEFEAVEIPLIDGMLSAAERWFRTEISAGNNADCLQLCGVLIVKAARASQVGSVDAAISYAAEALCLLDVMADAGDTDAVIHISRLTDWMGSSDFGKAAIERAKAIRVEI